MCTPVYRTGRPKWLGVYTGFPGPLTVLLLAVGNPSAVVLKVLLRLRE
jgi:hypothetical protein